MDLGLDGRVALVTGGSKGIGLAVARQLAEEGAELVLVARTQSELAAAAESIAARTGRAPRFATADVGDDASVAALAEQVGPVQILVNAAATPNAGGFPESELADHVNVKVAGALRTARAFAPGMVAAGWGRIVNISGLGARQAGSVVGSVRNVAVVAMTKNLADELGPQGVNVTVVHPGTDGDGAHPGDDHPDGRAAVRRRRRGGRAGAGPRRVDRPAGDRGRGGRRGRVPGQPAQRGDQR
jgi:NAD(P)-dependent dehydrogenase (short-subunit alcohol dehydrogenase family)